MRHLQLWSLACLRETESPRTSDVTSDSDPVAWGTLKAWPELPTNTQPEAQAGTELATANGSDSKGQPGSKP